LFPDYDSYYIVWLILYESYCMTHTVWLIHIFIRPQKGPRVLAELNETLDIEKRSSNLLNLRMSDSEMLPMDFYISTRLELIAFKELSKRRTCYWQGHNLWTITVWFVWLILTRDIETVIDVWSKQFGWDFGWRLRWYQTLYLQRRRSYW